MSVLSADIDATVDWSIVFDELLNAFASFKASPSNESHDIIVDIIKRYCELAGEWCEYDDVILVCKNKIIQRNSIVIFAAPTATPYNKPFIKVWRCWPNRVRNGKCYWEYVNRYSVDVFLDSPEWVQSKYDVYKLPKDIINILQANLDKISINNAI